MQVRPLGHLLLEQLGVLDRLRGRVYRARTDDDDQPVVFASDDFGSGEPRGGDRVAALRGGLDFMTEEGGLDEGVVL